MSAHPRQQLVGLDVGAESLYVATQTTSQLILLDDIWPQVLADICGHNPIVALEPTGRHYSAPIVTFLDTLGATLLQVDHATTKHYRQVFIATDKTDAHDATALMHIADEYRTRPIRGVKLLNPAAESLTSALRVTIQAHQRAIKDQTRATNRLRQLAHHIWPSLSQHIETYLRAVSVNAVTPCELHALAASFQTAAHADLPAPYQDGRSRAPLLKLVATLPADLDAPLMFNVIIPAIAKERRDAAEKIHFYEGLLSAVIVESHLRDVTRSWKSVPRCSLTAIASLHAAAHCNASSMDGDQLRGAIGFHPQRHQSGSQDTSSQALRGYRPARGALHLWTMQLLASTAPPNPIRDYWQQKKAEGHKYAFQAARGKLTRVLAALAQSGESCNWSTLSVE
jgi:hypothetical protein